METKRDIAKIFADLKSLRSDNFVVEFWRKSEMVDFFSFRKCISILYQCTYPISSFQICRGASSLHILRKVRKTLEFCWRCGSSFVLIVLQNIEAIVPVRIRHLSQWKTLRTGRVTVYSVKSWGREGDLPLRQKNRIAKFVLS